MATVTAYLTPDYANTVTVSNSTGTLTTGTATGVLVFGKRRLLHIAGMNATTSNRCALSYTLGNSVTGATAPAPTDASPFFMGDEGITIDLGDSYDSIQIANRATYNGAVSVFYSISIMSKF